MARSDNKYSVSQYALIACFSIALLFGQMSKLHMHIQHDGTPSPATTKHIINVHVASSLHDITDVSHHQDNIHDHHHSAEIDVSSSSFVKKVELLNPLITLFFIVIMVLCAPRLHRIRRWFAQKIKLTTLDYLLHPPLRAPPVQFSA